MEQQLGDGSSQAANSAVPWQQFSRARWGRLIAAAVICTVLVLLLWLKSEFNGWQALLLWAGASSFMWMALTSAVARQYLGREGLHLRVGKVETYPWDQLAGAWLSLATWLTVAVGLLAALLSWWGLAQRIEVYR